MATMVKHKTMKNKALTMSWMKLTYQVPSKNSRAIKRMDRSKRRTNNSTSREINKPCQERRMRRTKMKKRMIKSLRSNRKNHLSRLRKTTRGHNPRSSPRNSLGLQDRSPRKKSNSTLSSDYSVDFLLLFPEFSHEYLSVLKTQQSTSISIQLEDWIFIRGLMMTWFYYSAQDYQT